MVPYVIKFENTTEEIVSAIFLGCNDYSLSPNYGNSENIKISNVNGGAYTRFVNQSYTQNYVIDKMRIMSNNINNIRQSLLITRMDNGIQRVVPLPLSEYWDKFQLQADMIDVKKDIFINGNVYFNFTMLPKSNMLFVVYKKTGYSLWIYNFKHKIKRKIRNIKIFIKNLL